MREREDVIAGNFKRLPTNRVSQRASKPIRQRAKKKEEEEESSLVLPYSIDDVCLYLSVCRHLTLMKRKGKEPFFSFPLFGQQFPLINNIVIKHIS